MLQGRDRDDTRLLRERRPRKLPPPRPPERRRHPGRGALRLHAQSRACEAARAALRGHRGGRGLQKRRRHRRRGARRSAPRGACAFAPHADDERARPKGLGGARFGLAGMPRRRRRGDALGQSDPLRREGGRGLALGGARGAFIGARRRRGAGGESLRGQPRGDGGVRAGLSKRAREGLGRGRGGLAHPLPEPEAPPRRAGCGAGDQGPA